MWGNMVKFDCIAKAIASENGVVEHSHVDRIGKMIAYDEYYNSLTPGRKAWFTRRKNNNLINKDGNGVKHTKEIVQAIDGESLPTLKLIKPLSVRQIAAYKAVDTRRRNKLFIDGGNDKNNLFVDKSLQKHDLKFIKDGEQIHLSFTPLTVMQLAGHKAADTRKKNAKEWGGDGKRKFRNVVSEYFDKYGSGYTLALESKDLLFVKSLPNHDFEIYEHNLEIFGTIKVHDVSNIKALYYGDVGLAQNKSTTRYKYAFLDFCNTYKSNEGRLIALSNVLRDSMFIAVTFSLRMHKKEMSDYKIDLVKKLQSIFKNHTIEYEMSYRDGSPMIGIVLKNRGLS
jgi:hypothetical protein